MFVVLAVPQPPTNLVSQVEASLVKLTWTSGNNDSVVSFVVQYKQPHVVGAPSTEIHDVSGTEYTVVGLNASTCYEFRVVAVNNCGRSPSSDPLIVITRELGRFAKLLTLYLNV